MAISITITGLGLTVTLSATDGYNEDYTPQIPDAGATDVVETLDVTFVGGNSTLAANLSKLEQLFSYAREAQNGIMLSSVWFTVTLDSDVWRSELYDGKILSSGEWIKGERALGVRKTQIMIRRAPWFEANAETGASISNNHDSQDGYVNGVPIYNHDDGGHDNYVDIGTISGDLPAPARFGLLLTSQANMEIFAGIASYCDRSNLSLTYEAGSIAGAGVSFYVYTDASDGNNTYIGLTWSGTAETILNRWSLTTAMASAFAGRVFRPFVRFHSAIGGSDRFWFSVSAQYNYGSGTEKIWQSEETQVVLTDKAQVLPPMQMPPWPVGFLTSAPFELCLMVRCEATGSHTINLDYLTFLPCDSYLRLTPILSTYPDTNVRFESGKRWFTNNNYSIETHSAEGPGLWLVPGQSQRLCVVMRQGTGWDITRNPTIYLSYRPRKRTL